MTGNNNSINTPDELLQAYNAMFQFLGGSVALDPGESGLPHLCDAGLLRNLPVSSSNAMFEQASLLLRSPCPFKQQCRNTVGENYASLLGGKAIAEAYPAASYWKKSGTSVEEHHHHLISIYSKYNYCKAEESCIEADHLGVELLFANLLIEKYLTEDDYEIREMIGKELLSFIKDEMLSWLPRWAERVSAKSSTKCYIGISGLIIGSLEDVRDILSRQKLGL